MHRFGTVSVSRFGVVLFVLAASFALTACLPAQDDLAQSRIGTASKECKGAGDGSAACYFRNSPVQLRDKVVRLPGRSYPFRPTAKPLEFVDGAGRKWVAPTETLTDGASIPDIFVPIIGDPISSEFVNAAAVHDAYCGAGNEDGAVYRSAPWEAVHRQFYDSLIVSGVSPIKAKVMFAAVWLGGPRWYPKTGADDPKLERLPDSVRLGAMRDARDYVNRSNPTLAQLTRYLRDLEKEMERRAYDNRPDAHDAPADGVPPEDSELPPELPGEGFL